MKIKKIGIIILALVFTGGVAGVVGYRINLQDNKQQKLEVQKATEVKTKNYQTEVSSKNEQVEVKYNNNKQVEVKSKNEQTKVKHNNKQAKVKPENEQVKVKQEKIKNKQPKKEKLTHSDFEAKVQSYVAEFRKSGDDMGTLSENLNSINTKDLNTDDKVQFDNLNLAVEDWCMFTESYDYVRQAGDYAPELEQSMEYAKEALGKVNTNNLIATGMMSKATVDKYTSFLREYIEKKQQELDKQKKLNKQHSKLKTKQEKEDFYYNLINETMQREMKYIDSIKDPNVKGMVQSPMGAANGMETSLEMLFPEDTEILRKTLSSLTH